LLAIDPILDMGRTAVNVAGQALVPTLVAHGERMLDLDTYNRDSRGGVDLVRQLSMPANA
jgi:Na+/H+-dicarboxylate symporter